MCTWSLAPVSSSLFFFLNKCLLVHCRLPFLQKNRRLMLPIHSIVCLLTFGLSLPVAISLFPQMSQVHYEHINDSRSLGFNFQFKPTMPLKRPRSPDGSLLFQLETSPSSLSQMVFFSTSSQIEVSRLEPEIAMATDCKMVTYNKGLWWLTWPSERKHGWDEKNVNMESYRRFVCREIWSHEVSFIQIICCVVNRPRKKKLSGRHINSLNMQ